MAGPPPGPPPGPQSLPPEDPYLTDQIREQTQLSPIKPPPPMPMQMPGPDPKSPQLGQFRAANIPPTGPGMPPIPPPDNARQPQTPTTTPELEHYRMIADQRPERQPTKWWQTLAAGAVGGLEGYLASSPSAAIRSSVRQPGRLSQMINEGDYPQRLANWQMDIRNAQDMLEASIDVQKARSQQQVQEAQAWRYRNEPGIKADTALDVQESRNQGQIAKAGAVAAGYKDTARLKDELSLREVTPDKVKEMDERGHRPITFTDEPGKFYFHESTLKEVERSRLKDDENRLDYVLGQDKISSAERIAEDNRKSREGINKYTQSQVWARHDARLKVERQRAAVGGDTKFEDAKLNRLNKIENIYHKGISDLAKEYKFADQYDPKTPEMLTGPAAEQYWTKRYTIEKTFRDQRNEAERLYARQKGVDQPYVYQPEEGETYAERKLAEIRGKAQGAPAAAQSGQPTGGEGVVPSGGPAASPRPVPHSAPPTPAVTLPPGRRLPQGFAVEPATGKIKGPDGTYFELMPGTTKLQRVRK